MKFCKKYEEYLRGQEKKLKLPGFQFKRLKKILKNCSRDFQSQHRHGDGDCSSVAVQSCPDHCSVCDGTFFPFLLKEMSGIVGCFNQRAQELLELHLASGFRKYLLWFKGKLESDHSVLIQEGNELVNYAMMNAIAVRKILKKYDKIHYSKQGQTFKSKAQSNHVEILQSPWLSELIAFHINLKETKHKSERISSAFEKCSLAITDGSPSLTCELFDSVKLDIDLTCSICLDTVFDPVSLACGHIFCYMCACSAASVTIVNGLKSANPKAKCPLCREAGVYEGAIHLEELSILLHRSCPEYWEKRLQTERAERVQQAKEHWESMSPHCVQQVRSYDYHHYLCLLELPPSMRKAAFALRAFNVETSRAMDVATDPRIGLMRLVWWQEAIDKIYASKKIEHPIAQALSSVISENKISKLWLKRSVEARINDARREDTEIPETIDELEKYAEDTASTLLYMTLQSGGIRSTAADHAASHIGKAGGLLLLLKSLPYHATRNRHCSYIPVKVAEEHGLLAKQGGHFEIRLDSRERLCDAVFEMASVANAHLRKARDLAGTVPKEALPVLLQGVPAQVLLDSLRKVEFDVFDPRLQRGVLGVPPLWFQLKLKWSSLRGKY